MSTDVSSTTAPGTREVVPVPGLPDPTAYAYNHAIRAGDHVYIAGQCGVGDDGNVVSPEFAPQARQVLARLEEAVRAAGGSRESFVAMTVFITDIRLGAEFTAIRAEFFGETAYPTSALIGVSALMPPGALVEAQAIAYVPRKS